jgi:gas vesicle protein
MKLTMPWTVTNGHANGTPKKLEDVRDALGREVDHLAEVAAKMGREASTQAEGVAQDLARDAQKQTSVAMNRIADLAATLGPTIAAVGRQKMRQASEQAQALGKELSQVRITKEPPRKRSDLITSAALIGGISAGIGAGAAMMYLFDPNHGRTRRALLRDKLGKWLRIGREKAAGKAKDLRNRTVGVMAEVREAVKVPDEPLIAEELEESYQTWPEGTRVPTA